MLREVLYISYERKMESATFTQTIIATGHCCGQVTFKSFVLWSLIHHSTLGVKVMNRFDGPITLVSHLLSLLASTITSLRWRAP